MKQIGAYVSSLPGNATVLFNDLVYVPLDFYSDFTHYNMVGESYNSLSCNGIDADYVVMPLDQSLQAECNLSVVFTPSTAPQSLRSYDLFYTLGFFGWVIPNETVSDLQNYDLVVYQKNRP